MIRSESVRIEKAATKLLAVYGIKAIWDMHLAAAAAHGLGKLKLAASMIAVAEAAERRWMRRRQNIENRTRSI